MLNQQSINFSSDNIDQNDKNSTNSTMIQSLSTNNSSNYKSGKDWNDIQNEEEENKGNEEINNQNNQLQLRKCDVANVVWFTKQLSEQSAFLMFGDLLIETNEQPEDIDYRISLCNLFLKKKSVINVEYNKINKIIEIKFNNNSPGQTNYQYVKQMLLRSQNMKNYLTAQKLDEYEQNSNEIQFNFMRFFAENDQTIVFQSQKDYIDRMTQEFIQTNQQNNTDFYQYVFFSYIDENDLGHPVQIKQGICEASCALFGLERDQFIELMSRYGFMERILMKGFYSEYNQNEAVNQIILMQNVELITKIPILYNGIVNMTTADGIVFKIHLIVRQNSQVYNGVTITTLYTSEFHIEPQELQRIIEIRQSNSNKYSPYNYSDLILETNIYKANAEKFGSYLYNPYHFRPNQLQDIFPNKTCKFRYTNPQEL